MYFIHHARRKNKIVDECKYKNSMISKNMVYNLSFSLKRSLIKEQDLSSQREFFDKIIEEQKKQKEAEIVYDKERGIFPSGEYTVGEDIPTGRYLFKSRDKKQNASIHIYQSYQKYLEHDYLSFEYFDGDYFTTIRENGLFVVVKYADFQKMDN